MLKKQLNRYYLFEILRAMVFFGAVLVPFYTDWGGLNVFQIQLLQSWFMLWVFLFEVPTGVVADYFGRKHSLALGSVFAVLAAFIYTRQPELSYFLVAEMVFALGISLLSGADQAWVYDTLKEAKQESQAKTILGRAKSFHFVGILVGSLVGGEIASRFGLASPMLFTMVPFSLAVVVALTLKEPKVHSGPKESQRYWIIAKDGFKYFANHPKLRSLAIDSILVHSAAYFVIWFYQVVLKQLDISVGYFGIVHAGLVLVEIYILNNFENFEVLIKKIPVFSKLSYRQFSAIAVMFGFWALAISPNIITALLFIVFAGGFGLTRQTYIAAAMHAEIPSGKRATIISSISMFQRLALVFLNPLFGWIADYSMSWVLVLGGFLAALSFSKLTRNKL